MTDAAPTTARRGPVGRVLVVVPTYDERENLGGVLDRVLVAAPVDVLVVDDASPDGTGALADEYATREPRVSVLHREGKGGLGAAYVAGFGVGLARGYDVLVELDADGSHPPEALPAILDRLGDADLVLGSRWVPGGRVVNWPLSREVLSRGGNLYVRLLLGLGLRDATGGFRAYRREVLEAVRYDEVTSQGYCFQVEMAWRAVRDGFTAAEVPITFVERERGESKMSSGIVREALLRVTSWGLTRLLDRLRGARRPDPVAAR